MSHVKFFGIDCEAHSEKYANGQIAIMLIVAETNSNAAQGYRYGSPVCTATTCLPDFPFKEGETAIKNYSENSGVLEALVAGGLVEDTGVLFEQGFVSFPIVRVLHS